MKGLLVVVGLLIGASVQAGASFAQVSGPPPLLSIHRASLGLTVSGNQFTTANGGRVTSFLPGASLAYSVTENLSAGGTVERDFPRQTTIAKAGGRFKILQSERGQVAVGANLVGYGDTRSWLGVTKPTSWESVVVGSYDVFTNGDGSTLVWGIVQGGWDEQNSLKWVKIGLRWNVAGGR